MTVIERDQPEGKPTGIHSSPTNPERRAQQLAWSVIIGSFVVWGALVAASGWTARRYVLTAAILQHAALEIERGVVFFQDAASSIQSRATSGMALSEGTSLEAANQTEAEVRLFEGSSLHLFPGSELNLEELRLGRFSEAASHVVLSQRRGAVRYVVSDGSAPPFATTRRAASWSRMARRL